MKAHLTSFASTCFAALVFFSVAPVQAQSGPSDLDAFASDVETLDTFLILVDEAILGSDLTALGLADPARLDNKEWKKFGNAVSDALVSKNNGVQTSALRLIIAYGEHFDLSSSAVVDVIRLYREGKSEQIRRMAVVSLANMNSNLAIGFLELSSQHEQSNVVKATIHAVLADHSATRAS